MGRVVDLETRKVERLADEPLPVLRHRGSVVADSATLEDVDRWRRAARSAGRRLGWRIRTGVSRDGSRVWATSESYEMTDADRHRAGMKREALFRSEGWPGPPGSSSWRWSSAELDWIMVAPEPEP